MATQQLLELETEIRALALRLALALTPIAALAAGAVAF